jgi:hypothetical protein
MRGAVVDVITARTRDLERQIQKLQDENIKLIGKQADVQRLLDRWRRLPSTFDQLDYAALQLRCEDLELKNATLDAHVNQLRARLAKRPQRLAKKPGPKGPRGEGTVYFFGLRDFLKVGFTTRDVNDRIRDLSTGTPEPITLIAAIDGTHETERAWQRRFKPWHHEREWFQRAPCEAIIAAELKEAVSDRT